MKKIYLFALAVSFGLNSFGQGLQEKSNFGVDLPLDINLLSKESKSYNQVTNEKILGTVIWTDDFDTPSDWVIDNSTGPGGAEFGWTIDANSDGWWSANGITSTSGGNFAELSNGDPTNGAGTQALNVTYTLTSASPIDIIALGGTEKVTLEFEQFGARFNDLTEIQISTDGVNFVTVGDNFSFDIHAVGANNVWPNPDIKTVNLASVLTAATATSVWIRFSWTSNFAPNSDPNVWVAYGWYIDDVKIRTNPTNDLVLSGEYYGTAAYPYSRIPVSQIQPIDFSAFIANDGLVDQTNTVLTADINSGAFTYTTAPDTVFSNVVDTLSITGAFTPPATTGVPYTVTLSVASDSVDDIATNNSAVFPPFEISDFIYAYDDFGTPGAAGGDNGGNGAFEFEAGNSFDIFSSVDLYAIDVVIGAGTAAGTSIEGVLYEQTGTFTRIASTSFYSTTGNDIGDVVHLIFPAPQTLNPATTYFAAVHTFSEFFYGTSGSSPDGSGTASQTSLIFYPTMDNPTDQLFTTNTPMVRMNFDPNVMNPNSIEDLNKNISFSVSPNPSRGIFNISLDVLTTENINLSVRNVIGQTILSKAITVSGQTKESISLSDYDKGIYFLTIDNNKEQRTIKLIVE